MACPSRPQCTRATTEGREMTLRPREPHEALRAARRQQEAAEWKAEYAVRAGAEGTLSQGVRGFGLRRCRYIGLIHGFLRRTAMFDRARAALDEIAAELRDALRVGPT